MFLVSEVVEKELNPQTEEARSSFTGEVSSRFLFIQGQIKFSLQQRQQKCKN